MSKPTPVKKESEPVMKGTPASPNNHPRVARLPGSKFDALDSLGASNVPEGKTSNSLNWNDEYLETPTYLRKKAN
jgi:cell division protein FtsZ